MISMGVTVLYIDRLISWVIIKAWDMSKSFVLLMASSIETQEKLKFSNSSIIVDFYVPHFWSRSPDEVETRLNHQHRHFFTYLVLSVFLWHQPSSSEGLEQNKWEETLYPDPSWLICECFLAFSSLMIWLTVVASPILPERLGHQYLLHPHRASKKNFRQNRFKTNVCVFSIDIIQRKPFWNLN